MLHIFHILNIAPRIKKHKFYFHKTLSKMWTTVALFMTSLLYVFLLLLSSTAKVAEAARPLTESNSNIPPPSYVSLKPKEVHGGRHGFGSKALESCLPKGFHRSSAPSRYVNYHTLGSSSSLCDDSSKRMSKP